MGRRIELLGIYALVSICHKAENGVYKSLTVLVIGCYVSLVYVRLKTLWITHCMTEHNVV